MPMPSILLLFHSTMSSDEFGNPLTTVILYCSLCRTNYKYLTSFILDSLDCFLLYYLTHPVSFVLYLMSAL